MQLWTAFKLVLLGMANYHCSFALFLKRWIFPFKDINFMYIFVTYTTLFNPGALIHSFTTFFQATYIYPLTPLVLLKNLCIFVCLSSLIFPTFFNVSSMRTISHFASLSNKMFYDRYHILCLEIVEPFDFILYISSR